MLRTDGGDRKSAGGTTDDERRDSADSGRGGLRRGDTLARRYELDRPAGKGGMGAVWVARDRVLDIEVAIKVIRRDARVPEAEARLLTEARAAARLGHPAVVRVLDFGRTDWGDPFMAMELLEGETLAALLAREKRLSPARAVQLLLPVIDGLAALHAKQIIHRDVKPDNIYLARDEASRLQPKIVDFGIAKLEQRGAFEAITHCGEVLGSPAYMSPEQARGLGGIDHRTDIWSLCVVLFELVAGARPFQARNYHAMLRAIIEEPPAELPESVCDKELRTIILAGLRKQKDERWGSMRELGEALALWLYERGVKEDICASCIRSAWLEAGLSGVKVELPPSVRPLPGMFGKGYSPRIIDAAALAATERQRLSSASQIPSTPDGLKEIEVIEQMRRLLCTGSTTESDGEAAAKGAEAIAEEREQHAYTKTASDQKRSAPGSFEPKLLQATGTRRRAAQLAAAVITCVAMGAAGAWVGLFGGTAAPAEGKPVELGASESAFASTQAARPALTNEGTKPAVIEASEAKAAGAEEAGMEADAAAQRDKERGAAQAGQSPAPSEPRRAEAQGSRSREKAVISSPQTSATPKKGAAPFRKTGSDDFNFGF